MTGSAKYRAVTPLPAGTLRGIEPAPVSTDEPKLDWLDPRSLCVEEDYQRELSRNSIAMIRRIIENWSWAKIKPAICVGVGNRLVVIDGQHTAIAAASRGDIAKIPVMIVDAKTVKERAEAFVSQNRDRLALTTMHMHYAALAAGEEIAVAVNQACAKAKARILRHPPGTGGAYKIGDTFAVGIIGKIVSKIGAHQGGRVLKVLVDAKRAPLSAHEIGAVYELLFDAKYKGKVDQFDLVTIVRSKPMEQWRAEAWSLVSEGLPRRQATAAAWFRALSKGRRYA